MEFEMTEEQRSIQQEVRRLCARFGDDYWRAKDRVHEFPEEFYRAFAEGGWLGIAMPEQYGGAGKGITEAALIMTRRRERHQSGHLRWAGRRALRRRRTVRPIPPRR